MRLFCLLMFPTFLLAASFHDFASPVVHDLSVSPIDSSNWVEVKKDLGSNIQIVEVINDSPYMFRIGFSTNSTIPKKNKRILLEPKKTFRKFFNMPIGADIFVKTVESSGFVNANTGKLYFSFRKKP